MKIFRRSATIYVLRLGEEVPFFQSAINSYIGSENERADLTLNFLNQTGQVMLLNRPVGISFAGQDLQTLLSYQVPQTGDLATVTWSRITTLTGVTYEVGIALIAASASGERVFNSFAVLGQTATNYIPDDTNVQVGVTTNLLTNLTGNLDILDRERLVRITEVVTDQGIARNSNEYDVDPQLVGTSTGDIVTVTRYGNATHAIFEYSNSFTIPVNESYSLAIGGWTINFPT